MPLIFLFIDGVGLGLPQQNNPFYTKRYPGFEYAAGGQAFLKGIDPVVSEEHLFKPIDACLSVDGLPQSGTGQATLFSGINASEILGRHFGPYPHSKTRYLLEEESLFNSLQNKGLSCYFMNAYPEIFFDRAEQMNRWSCTTLMVRGAGNKLNTIEDVLSGDAITAEILQDKWQSMLNLKVPDITAQQAASRVLRKADEHDLVMTEYYLTDKVGHEQDPTKADGALKRFNDFLEAMISEKSAHHTIIMVSDHGNVEDLSTKSHTLNDVPLLVYGRGAKVFGAVESLIDIKDACLQWFEDGRD